MLRDKGVWIALCLLLGAVSTSAALGQWSEGPRSFLEDGPGWLLSTAERSRFEKLDEADRSEWIEGFLARGAAGELSAEGFNRVLEGRLALARRWALTPADARYRLLFLAGPPAERLPIVCPGVLRPLEVWTFAASHPLGVRALAEQHSSPRVVKNEKFNLGGGRVFAFKGPFRGWKEGVRLVLYQPTADAPFRLWVPVDGKRALYARQMEAELSGWEERTGRTGVRPDLALCPAVSEVDRATGINALRAVAVGRPKQAAVSSVLEPPDDLAAWARRAADGELAGFELGPAAVQATFAGRSRGRVAAQFLVSLGADAALEPDPQGRLVLHVEGVLERGGRRLDQFQLRFMTRYVEGGPVALVIERDLSPGEPVVARFLVSDEVGGGLAYAVDQFLVPRVGAPQRPPGGTGFLFRRLEKPYNLEHRTEDGPLGGGQNPTPVSDAGPARRPPS